MEEKKAQEGGSTTTPERADFARRKKEIYCIKKVEVAVQVRGFCHSAGKRGFLVQDSTDGKKRKERVSDRRSLPVPKSKLIGKIRRGKDSQKGDNDAGGKKKEKKKKSSVFTHCHRGPEKSEYRGHARQQKGGRPSLEKKQFWEGGKGHARCALSFEPRRDCSVFLKGGLEFLEQMISAEKRRRGFGICWGEGPAPKDCLGEGRAKDLRALKSSSGSSKTTQQRYHGKQARESDLRRGKNRRKRKHQK